MGGCQNYGNPRFPLKDSYKGNISIEMGGCQNYGAFLGVHIKGDTEIDVEIDTDSQCGWWSNPFRVLSILRQLVFRGPKGGL